MVSQGLLIRMEAKTGMDADVEEFLRSIHPLAGLESDTVAWFALRFGRSEYGIFAAFPDEAAREAHLDGSVARGLMKAGALFTHKPTVQNVSVIAGKLPGRPSSEADTKGLLLSIKAKEGHEEDVEEFLLTAAPTVRDEPKTTAWFAIRFDRGEYGIFDVFPDNGGRFAHLTGHVPRELARHGFSLLGGMPDLELVNVVAEKLP